MSTQNKFFVFFLFVLAGASGCDKISAIFSGQPSSKENKSIEASSPLASAKPAEDINAALPADVLARVGDWTLTMEDFNARLKNLKELAPQFDIKDAKSKKLVLDELVNQQLLVKEAETNGTAQKKDVVEAVNEFKRTVLVRESINQLVGNIQATEQEAQDYYNQNEDVFVEPADWHLREIVVPTEAEAKEILIEVLKGTDFAETAKTRSKAKSAAAGGDLGFKKDLDPSVVRAVGSLEAGGISSVIKVPDGYAIVKLEEKKGGKPLNFTDIKKDVVDGLTDLKRRQALISHIDELKQKTNVKVNESLL
ncbi:MAG TPA: peptidyl-prolyl cis-trans isomerase [Candidatus Omnitrophota bacterium]|nr:peptidyl-prolyl cis-trans isomerase [Candidatus Omnitrophota bacterium]